MKPAPVFAKKMAGNALLMTVVLIGFTSIILQATSTRIMNAMSYRASLDRKQAQADAFRYLTERIDCVRTLEPFNENNKCDPTNPAHKITKLVWFNKGLTPVMPETVTETLDKYGNTVPITPYQRFPITGGWYAQLGCGSKDLTVRLVHHTAPKNLSVSDNTTVYDRDIMTGKVLGFNTQDSIVATGDEGTLQVCPTQFGVSSQPPTVVLTMSMDSLQSLGAHYLGNGSLDNIRTRCNGTIGTIATITTVPLAPECRLNGDENVLTPYCAELVTSYKEKLVVTALTPDLKTYSAEGKQHATSDCASVCNSQLGYRGGRLIGCNEGAIFLPPFRSYSKNRADSQATCLCIK